MKGQQKAAETEEGTVQIQEGAVATGEDPTSVAIASIQSAATFPDPNIKYVFRTENGGTQVMYRVIQVADGQLDGQTEGTSAISGYPATQSMTQAVIQGAFTSEDAVETEATATETHYTYFPTTAVADTSTSAGAGTTATAVVTTQNSEALLGQPTPTGQFFVMMSPQEVLQGGPPRSIAPRAHPYSPTDAAGVPPGSRRHRELPGTRSAGHSTTKWSAGAGTRSTTGSCSSPRSSLTAPWRTPNQGRARVGSCPKPATTSRSCGRATTASPRSCRASTSSRWTTRSCGSRLRT
ncbi:upstream stimulatory factor 1 isoform 5-T5 [Guaruba guarouba]